MIRRLGLGLSVSILAVILTAWAGHYVKTHSNQVDEKLDWAVETPTEQLGQELKTPSTPAYDLMEEDPADEGSSEMGSCEDSYDDDFDFHFECLFVNTKATDAETLASITVEVLSGYDGQVEFARRYDDWYSGGPQAISYCFPSKHDAVSYLGGDLNWANFEADLLGRIDDCYIVVYIYEGA